MKPWATTEPAMKVIWRPNPGPQNVFLSTAYREALYGGAAGGGKSDALLIAAVRFIDQPDHNAVLFRRSYPVLRPLIERSRQIYPALRGSFNEAKHEWRFPSGATVILRYIERFSDVFNYQGDAFTFIGWDELTQLPADGLDGEERPINQAYLYMMTRLRRRADSKVRLMVRATCNPGGVGHHWVKERFQIPDDGGPSVVKDAKTGLHRAFIPARITDNPHLAGSEYERTLEGLSKDLKKALRDGRWDIYAGAMFSTFNPQVHVVDPFHIPAHWRRWRGADDGFAAPACVLWMTRDPDTRQVIVYQELYKAGMSPGVFAEKVKDLDGAQPVIDREDERDEIRALSLDGILDSAAFASNGQSEVSRGDAMNRMGCRWKPAMKGPGSRVLRVKATHALLEPMKHDPKKRPGLVIFRNCKNLIRTLPALPKDQTNAEDIDTDAEDHPFDALTYGLQYRPATATMQRVKGV
jgi:hypothetical protein